MKLQYIVIVTLLLTALFVYRLLAQGGLERDPDVSFKTLKGKNISLRGLRG